MSDDKGDKNEKKSWSEEDVLKFWQENNIFEKTLAKESPQGNFVFYDGPPFATGLPHYGHILTSVIKDAIPRYQTMRGFRAPRRWGWDCHGLPVENLIEQDLKLNTKKDIEKFGIEKFNEAARQSVLRFADDWKKIIPRIGRWVDMEQDYKTMDANYTESVWWVFKELYDKGLIYEGHKSMHICPRCETTLANFEVAQGYRDIKDLTVTVKFELEDEQGTYFLSWTTTPWTLPGNVALAVNPKVDYVKIKYDGSQSRSSLVEKKEETKHSVINPGTYILAKDIFWKNMQSNAGLAEELRQLVDYYGDNEVKDDLLKNIKYEEFIKKYNIEEIEGKDLVGKKYKPPFDYYYKDKSLENRENGWKVYPADFVTTEEGVGIVHIAPAFGEDDMDLGKEYDLPFVQHVGMDGHFKKEVKEFADQHVKPKDDPLATNIAILKYLAERDLLFAKEKITHSYPFCWRCDTPLLNYAASSWFIKVTAIKTQLLKINKKINWIPPHIKDGRFGKWLEGARDWAISRSRFWGAPLPVWKCEKCDEIKVVGSVADLKNAFKKSNNNYFVMRHGEAEHNVQNVESSDPKNEHHLTEKGKEEVKEVAKKIKDKKIDLIFASDFVRTRETAEIIADIINTDKKKIIFDKRLRELNMEVFNDKDIKEYHSYFSSPEEKFTKTPPKGENLIDLKKRVGEFLYKIDDKYQDKNILIVSHGDPIWMMLAVAEGADAKKASNTRSYPKTGEVKKFDFAPLPHNQNFELELHRPYIDELKFECPKAGFEQGTCKGVMKRVPEVFDCWFESGSMPYGQAHYPFENKDEFEKNFPAKFIAEGVDQTRGWFYNLLVLSTALFDKPAFENVIVNGIILAEDGQKMSKRLKNYADPMEIVERYGADSLRYYLLSSPLTRAETLNFSEKGVDEVHKKVVLRLTNVLSFYEMYTDKTRIMNYELRIKSKNVLDQWVLARLDQLVEDTTKAMDGYELDKAVRPIGDFIDDLSTWYLRRSRDRFKEEGNNLEQAIGSLHFVLMELAKIIAPFTPFIAEKIYKSLGGKKNSAHMEEWPKIELGIINYKLEIIDEMEKVRKISSLGLEARAKAEIKIRQPLASLKIRNSKSEIRNNNELIQLIKDELNIKEIIFDNTIKNEVELTTELTTELIQEGQIRELTRAVQNLRKVAKLIPQQEISLQIEADQEGKDLISKFKDDFKKSVNAEVIKFEDSITDGEELKIGDLRIKVKIN